MLGLGNLMMLKAVVGKGGSRTLRATANRSRDT